MWGPGMCAVVQHQTCQLAVHELGQPRSVEAYKPRRQRRCAEADKRKGCMIAQDCLWGPLSASFIHVLRQLLCCDAQLLVPKATLWTRQLTLSESILQIPGDNGLDPGPQHENALI